MKSLDIFWLKGVLFDLVFLTGLDDAPFFNAL
jgi:hypothetical protein